MASQWPANGPDDHLLHIIFIIYEKHFILDSNWLKNILRSFGSFYIFNIVDDVNENDQVFQKEESRVIIDNTSLQFLEGAEIDYCEELIGSSFKINNPNATSSCGCGTSFSFSPSFK